MPRESFLAGAVVLTVAAFITKVLGAVYRIPLYPIIGDQGFGLFQMAYPIYGMVLVLSTSGINVAISKLVAERLAKGDARGASEAFKSSLFLLGSSGLVFSILLFAGARFIAESVTRDARATLCIAAISPAVLFVSVMSAYRGLFQGIRRMTPSAVSQIIEQFVRVVTMLVLAVVLIPRGVEYAAAGATFGAVTGAVGGLIYLLWVYRRDDVPRLLGYSQSRISIPTMAAVLRIAIPVSMASGVLGLVQIVDMGIVPWRLQAMGLATRVATAQYGEMSGAALPLVNMPTILTAALQVSLVPAIAADIALRDSSHMVSRIRTSLRLTFQVMLPAAVGLFILADPISRLLFGDPDIAISLSALAACTVFMGLQQTTSGILQGMGQLRLPVKNLLWGVFWKLLLTTWLTGTIGIKGACYGTVAAFLVAGMLNLWSLMQRFGGILDVKEAILLPAISCVAMVLVVKGVYGLVLEASGHSSLATVAAILFGAVGYLLALAVGGGLRKEDVEMVPKVGPTIARYMRKIGLLR